MSKTFSLETFIHTFKCMCKLKILQLKSSKTNSEHLLRHETDGNPIKRWHIFLNVQTEKQILLKISE